jgi:DNA-binding cell septation regulator SpoVG
LCQQFNEIASMPVRSLCQNFFRDVLRPFHQYRRNALLDATAALSRGASLTLTSIVRHRH